MLLLLLSLLSSSPGPATEADRQRACAAEDLRLTEQRATVWRAMAEKHRAAVNYYAARDAAPPELLTPAQAGAVLEAFDAMARASSVLRMVQVGAAITEAEVAEAKARLGCAPAAQAP